MNILALDLGTHLGWALRDANARISGGTENFSPRVKDGPGQRWLKFTAHLSAVKRSVGEINVIYFEDVKRHGPDQVIAAHVYGGFLAHLQVFCDVNRIRLVPVGVGIVKKSWTGKGNAKKADMITSAFKRGFDPKDDNHADALAVLHIALARELDSKDPFPVRAPKELTLEAS